ncbi:MAG: c-type cytochrome [Microcoleus sp. PH2017_10_PVI_O_A]|uniref:c-type cytochrome n=1 Tax=unclassified Microcoleus TaxID=2642155 RepID=UPI001DB660E4|nr:MULTISPECIES: c-type cytochrome [unclassified Microcoleus]TAE74564.1 MAG: cytochrome C6 [Oscillatoriales cyanobacterium]MCC3409705.1 c-type cytochrome [Microcoleus sp. PH2017_10_PVI_O_A]MCC3463979.1 c-type cytochrome [Microcoleus sp. PH2017_11_PCY_U_A]MCC3482304.1 c-type cytochrome [Microcoleus sp. PH2017_12_PCY_D_A]MCC3532142.1 c-type cytochrome [Microcoleus sp. PH2017_21_RUC_O_A]
MISLNNLKKILTLILLLLTLAFAEIATNSQSAIADTATTPATATAAEVFTTNCAGCHINGSNIIRRGKNLKQKALKKYKMDSIANISNLVTNGKGIMPGYKDRLSEQQIIDVSAYVLSQAETDWK